MSARVAAVLAGLAVLSASVAEQQEFPHVSERVPHFEKRLQSTRWQVRDCLLGELDGRDAKASAPSSCSAGTRTTPWPVRPSRRYEMNFIRIDKFLFRPEMYFRGTQFLGRTPASGRELVDGCLKRLRVAEKARDAEPHAADRDDPGLVYPITVVGILGVREDAAQLEPFLASQNDYVAIRAAVAVIRLGERVKGGDALVRLTKRDPAKHLNYMTGTLVFLKELEHPEFRLTLLDVLAAVDRTEWVQPNWLNGLLLLVCGDR